MDRHVVVVALATLLTAATALGSDAARRERSRGQPAARDLTVYASSPGGGTVPAGGVFEATFAADVEAGDVPEDATVQVRFAGPGGRQATVGGFFYSRLANGQALWKARFAPAAAGSWRFSYAVTLPGTAPMKGSGAFAVTAAASRGFLRLGAANPLRLEFQDGRPFFPMGFNDCLGVRAAMQMDGGDRFGAFHGSVSTDAYLRAYSEAGFNMFRFSQSNCSPALVSADMEEYDYGTAAYFDWLIQRLRGRGFRVFYGLLGYRLPNDPPTPPPEALTRFLQYSVDRWGAYVDVWELENERRASAEWIVLAADAVRARDPYGHPITTSWQRPELPAVEINAPHWYGSEDELESDRLTANKARRWRESGKPVVVGEQGNSARPDYQWGNWLPDSAVRMRLRTWTSFFEQIGLLFWNNTWATNGSGGGASNLYIGPEERTYAHVLRAFARLADGADAERVEAPAMEGASAHDLRVYALESPAGLALYLVHASDHDTELRGATLVLDAPANAQILWLDPATGSRVATAPLPPGATRLPVPPFRVDLAALLPAQPLESPPVASLVTRNPQADGDLDNDGRPDRGPAVMAFGEAPLDLTFDGSGSWDPDGGPVTVAWRFGDGSPEEAGPVVSHTFGRGNFLLTVTVTDDDGDVAATSLMVRATADPRPDQNDPPILDGVDAVEAAEGELVLVAPIGLDRELAGGSYNRDGHTVEPLEYGATGLPEGARFEVVGGSGSPQLRWVPNFDQAGVYTATFTLKDAAGARAPDQPVVIRVRDVPEATGEPPSSPTASPEGPRAAIFLPRTWAR